MLTFSNASLALARCAQHLGSLRMQPAVEGLQAAVRPCLLLSPTRRPQIISPPSQQPAAVCSRRNEGYAVGEKQRPAQVRFHWLPVSIDWSMANPCPMGAAQRCEGLPVALDAQGRRCQSQSPQRHLGRGTFVASMPALQPAELRWQAGRRGLPTVLGSHSRNCPVNMWPAVAFGLLRTTQSRNN